MFVNKGNCFVWVSFSILLVLSCRLSRPSIHMAVSQEKESSLPSCFCLVNMYYALLGQRHRMIVWNQSTSVAGARSEQFSTSWSITRTQLGVFNCHVSHDQIWTQGGEIEPRGRWDS